MTMSQFISSTTDYIIRLQRAKAVEVEMFEKVFNMNYSKNFNDVEYHLK